MERYGESVTITPADRVKIELRAVVDAETLEDQATEDGRIVKRRARDITISLDPQSEWGGWERPELHATVSLLGLDYQIESAKAAGSESITLHLVRPAIGEYTRKGYRQ